MTYIGDYASPLGDMLMSSDGESLTGLWFMGQKYCGETLGPDLESKDDLRLFQNVRKWLDSYFAGQNPAAADLPLAPSGGRFRRSVWDALSAIPYGTVTTYGAIARGIGCGSARAVGGAVGRNPLSIIVPCHRVVGANGSLTGYAGGIDRKMRLLEIEKVELSGLFAPKRGTAL